MEIEEVFKFVNKNLLTPEFLERVERWARYAGRPFDVGDIDISVKNMGVFVVEGKIHDVTQIENNCVCSDYGVRILVAERHPEWADDIDYMSSRPAKLYIFAIYKEGSNKAESDEYPSFERLKKDFEANTFTHYKSMISEKYSDYELIPFNDETDRFRNFSSIEMDLNCLSADETSAKKLKRIKTIPRLDAQGRNEAWNRSMDKMRGKVEKLNKSVTKK